MTQVTKYEKTSVKLNVPKKEELKKFPGKRMKREGSFHPIFRTS